MRRTRPLPSRLLPHAPHPSPPPTCVPRQRGDAPARHVAPHAQRAAVAADHLGVVQRQASRVDAAHGARLWVQQEPTGSGSERARHERPGNGSSRSDAVVVAFSNTPATLSLRGLTNATSTVAGTRTFTPAQVCAWPPHVSSPATKRPLSLLLTKGSASDHTPLLPARTPALAPSSSPRARPETTHPCSLPRSPPSVLLTSDQRANPATKRPLPRPLTTGSASDQRATLSCERRHMRLVVGCVHSAGGGSPNSRTWHSRHTLWRAHSCRSHLRPHAARRPMCAAARHRPAQ